MIFLLEEFIFSTYTNEVRRINDILLGTADTTHFVCT
jgi:hypothetical protein